jgi:signal transduction histidine kinase
VAQERAGLDQQIAVLRSTIIRAFAILGLGLILMAALQATFGLWPLRRVRRSLAQVRTGAIARIDDRLPIEIAPMVEELNDLLAHNERQAEEARRHAGNLAHALKTPLTVVMNEATANSPDLCASVIREATDDAAAGRPSPRPRPGRSGRRGSTPEPGRGVAGAQGGRTRGQPPVSAMSRSTSTATTRRSPMSSIRISRRCSAI